MKYLLHFFLLIDTILTETNKEAFILNNRDQLEVKLKKEWCKGCGICVEFCPKNVLALDHHSKIEIVNKDACILCGQCEMRCPDFAIFLGGKDDE